ncbi:hypothetical protein Tco_1140574 [Tanacetum coccineum]
MMSCSLIKILLQKEQYPKDSTAGITVSTALINISTARETRSSAGRVVYGRRSKEARKDKGKAIMTEPEPEKKSKKLLEQERLGLEEAIRLQEKLMKRKELKSWEKKKPAEFQEIEIEQIEKDTTGKRKKSLPRKRTRNVDSLSTKYPIVDWKTYTLLENFVQDIVELYRLVKERYSSSKPEGYDLMLWGDLHTLFDPDEESEIWMNQNEYNLISWSLCDFCRVHILLMQNGIAIHMLTEKKYPLSQEMISKMLSKRLEVDQESTQAYELLKFIRSQGRIVGNKSSSRVNTAKKDDGIFISQDKYVDEILKKFGFLTLKTTSTPMETSKPLMKDENAKDVDNEYLKGLDKKSTTGGCQFLGRRLISWQCKKQTIVANSTTKAEYVAAASCCGQVLWIQNQLLDYGYNFINTKIFIDNESTICIVKNPMFHSKTKHIEIRHHSIRDSNEKKLIQMIKIHIN